MPKNTDLSVHTAEELARIARSLNNRPRKTLGYTKPSEKLAELIAHRLNAPGRCSGCVITIAAADSWNPGQASCGRYFSSVSWVQSYVNVTLRAGRSGRLESPPPQVPGRPMPGSAGISASRQPSSNSTASFSRMLSRVSAIVATSPRGGRAARLVPGPDCRCRPGVVAEPGAGQHSSSDFSAGSAAASNC